jgi:hypothetical protein
MSEGIVFALGVRMKGIGQGMDEVEKHAHSVSVASISSCQSCLGYVTHYNTERRILLNLKLARSSISDASLIACLESAIMKNVTRHRRRKLIKTTSHTFFLPGKSFRYYKSPFYLFSCSCCAVITCPSCKRRRRFTSRWPIRILSLKLNSIRFSWLELILLRASAPQTRPKSV